MPKKRTTPTRPRDLNELAFWVGQIATHEAEDTAPAPANPAAAKRGAARAAKLTAAERSEIAKKAAAARWKKSLPCLRRQNAGGSLNERRALMAPRAGRMG